MENSVIRSQAQNEEQLKSIINSKFYEINESDCDAFYRKMLNYIQKSERREEINE